MIAVLYFVLWKNRNSAGDGKKKKKKPFIEKYSVLFNFAHKLTTFLPLARIKPLPLCIWKRFRGTTKVHVFYFVFVEFLGNKCYALEKEGRAAKPLVVCNCEKCRFLTMNSSWMLTQLGLSVTFAAGGLKGGWPRNAMMFNCTCTYGGLGNCIQMIVFNLLAQTKVKYIYIYFHIYEPINKVSW